MAQRAASAPNTVDRALQASLPGWHYFRGTHRQPCHTHNRPTEDMVDRQKREKMHAHKRGGPAIKTATRPRTMDRSSRTSRLRNTRKELQYQGFRLRQVTFHGERSRLPRNLGAPHNGRTKDPQARVTVHEPHADASVGTLTKAEGPI